MLKVMKKNRITLVCEQCGKKFEVTPSQVKNGRKFCCRECGNEYRKLHKKPQVNKIKKICPNCGKEFEVWESESKKMKFCSMECRSEYNSTEIICLTCGKKFRVPNSQKDVTKFCSRDCYDKNREKNKTGVYTVCENCGKEIYKTKSTIYEHTFCSNKCRSEYQTKTNTVFKICEMCGEEYSVKKSHADNSRFCSKECYDKWQSINLVGENNSHYEGVTANCAYCGELIHISKHRLKTQDNFFCNMGCKIAYYSIPENRTEKQRIAIKKFNRSAIKYTRPRFSKPHEKVVSVLDKLNIRYNIEELVKYYKLDIFLKDYSLGIEVNGDFWHCSPIKYKDAILYKRQLYSLRKDKSKHTYVKRKYGYELLYLWESDVNGNIDVCEKLILEYIKRNGILGNYHSFNYYIDDIGNLKLRENIIIPYQDMKRSEYQDKVQLRDT